MGGGGGVIIEEIGLAQFQASRGAELNVEVNGGVNTYTWVAGGEYTVSANVEIIFEETDRMVIPGNTTVTLEGIFNISETTDNFSRIQNDGTLTIAEGAEIQFGRIVGSEGGGGEDDGIGIQNDGTLTIAEGAEIEFGTIVGTPGGEETPSGIGIRTTSSDSTYVLGKITFNKVDVAAVGLDVHSSAPGRGGKVTLESTGRLIYKTIKNMQESTSTTDGIFIDDNGIFEQSGSITVESIIGVARLMCVGRFDTVSPSRYTQTSKGTITIENMIGFNEDMGSRGIFINSGGTFTQNGSVRIKNVQENATCIHVGRTDAPHPAFCNYNQNENAVITIDKVAGRDVETDDDNNSTGIFITGKGIFTQNGTITFEDLQQNVSGITVGDSSDVIEDAVYNQNGTITIKKIAGSNNNNSNGISTQGLGTFTQNGNITIKDIQQNVNGILVGTSNGTKEATYVQQTGTIAIESIHSEGDKYSRGIVVSGGTEVTFTQNDDITIENVTGLVSCILVGSDNDDAGNTSTYNQAGGSLTISDVRTIDSAGDKFTNGFSIRDSNSKYNQTGGTINITNIGGADTVRGILVKAGELRVTNELTITGLGDGRGLGLESRVDNGVRNSGTVTVSDFKLNYTDNGVTNLNPPGDFPEFEEIGDGVYN